MGILGVRYDIIRKTKGKLALWFFILTIAFALIMTSYTGEFIKIIANLRGENSEAAQIYANTYLNSYLNGELGGLVATTLGLTIVSVIISPFTGTSATSLISHHYLVSIRSNMKHRFTDSLITQFFSSISLLQLMTLTAVASLLTIDGGRKTGILYAWASWPVLVVLSTVFVWVAEYLYRKLGEKKRIVILGVVLGFILLIVLYNREQAMTVFGIGTGYASIIQGISDFSIISTVIAFTMLVVLGGLFLFIAYKMSHVALSLPDLFAKQDKPQKTIKPRKFSNRPSIELFNITFLQLWRNVDIRKPLLTATIFSIGVMLILSGNPASLSTVVFVIPLMVSLSWGTNIFGILGNGLPWIVSKPNSMKNILWVFAGTQMGIVILMAVMAIIPVLVLNKIDSSALASFLVSLIACSSLMTRSSIHKSVHNPHPYKAGYRGEPILPPATLIAYTLKLSLWSGMYGLLMYSLTSDILIQLGLMGLAIIWSAIRLAFLNRKFNKKPELRNNIIFTVSAN